MNSDLIMQILQWLVPSGIAGSLWAWLRHRENNKVLAAKERNDAYKEMYDNLSGTLIDLQNENIKLYKAVRELNRTIQRASTCRHYADCPIRGELQKSGAIGAERAQPKRQPLGQKRVRSPAAACSAQHGEDNIRIRNELFREKEKPPPETVHEPTGFQWFQIWIGRTAVAALLLGILRRRFINP